MRKLLLFILLSLFIFSCSDDEVTLEPDITEGLILEENKDVTNKSLTDCGTLTPQLVRGASCGSGFRYTVVVSAGINRLPYDRDVEVFLTNTVMGRQIILDTEVVRIKSNRNVSNPATVFQQTQTPNLGRVTARIASVRRSNGTPVTCNFRTTSHTNVRLCNAAPPNSCPGGDADRNGICDALEQNDDDEDPFGLRDANGG